MAKSELAVWELWYPDAGATGMPFARGRMDPTDVLWVHAAPPTLSVTVRVNHDNTLAARGSDLTRSGLRLPMTRLWIDGDQVRREDRWPNQADLGALVILSGGEVGRLTAWWNAADGSEWRWQVAFYNHQ